MLGRASSSQIWSYYGSVLTGDPTNDESNLYEPSVMYESGTYKMWATGGWNTPHINYYTSADGISWTPYGSNPVISGAYRSCVFKDGSTYYLYVAPTGGAQYDQYTSSDGITWTLANSAVLSKGSAGAWDDGLLGNPFVWKESANDWRMIYEARRSGAAWHIGYATSSDGISWSKSGSNPVLSETGSTGGPFIYKDAAGTYWMWAHRSDSGVLPTDMSRYRSTNLTSWTRDPANNTMTRLSTMGNSSANGQVADITLLTVGNQTYAWVTGDADGSASTGHAFIGLWIARLPLAQLVNTSEGY